MMTRSLLLFAHVTGVLALFAGFALEWVATSRQYLQRLYGIAFGLILVSGVWMAARLGVQSQLWVRIPFILLFVIAILGRAWRDGRASVSLRIALGLGVVFLMISKSI